MRTYWKVSLAMASWTFLIGAGFFYALQYDNTPAAVYPLQRTWPAKSELVCRHDRFNLVVAIHPRCPCTRATLDELTQLIAERPGAMMVHVLVYRPKNAQADWDQTDISRSAQKLPGADVRSDDDATEARRFGTLTSGHVLLYDTRGVLCFSGGITDSRGHAGDSIGRRLLLDLLAGDSISFAETPVFGCSLVRSCTLSTEEGAPCSE